MMIKWISETLKWCEKEPEKPRLYPKTETNFTTSILIIPTIIVAILLAIIIISAISGTCYNESGMLRNFIIMGA